MNYEPMPEHIQELSPAAKLRSALRFGCGVTAIVVGLLLVLIFFNPDRKALDSKLMIGTLIIAFCLGVPLFLVTATGTFIQLTYRNILLRWLRQYVSKKANPNG